VTFRRQALALVALGLLAGCGRTEVYRRRLPTACEILGATRPCQSVCGAGTERCVDGMWSGCDAPAPLDPPASLAIDGTVRDFRESHPDFEDRIGDDRGIVGTFLGNDGAPLYPHSGETGTVTSPASFAQWFHDAPGTNQPTAIALSFKRISQTPLVYSFTDNDFFPIDGRLFGNEGHPHNFHFTLELHTELEYRGGETLSFQGDDDLWVFVGGRLAIDLGGPHPTQAASISLDTLRLVPGLVYPLDVFFAERHTSSSTLRVETTNAHFVRCP